VADADVAAEQFTWLVLAAPLNRVTLQPDTDSVPEDQLERIATEAVTTSLSRYGPQPLPAPLAPR
jgi:TetR/AcrR family transcriptional repressor of mexJK operon